MFQPMEPGSRPTGQKRLSCPTKPVYFSARPLSSPSEKDLSSSRITSPMWRALYLSHQSDGMRSTRRPQVVGYCLHPLMIKLSNIFPPRWSIRPGSFCGVAGDNNGKAAPGWGRPRQRLPCCTLPCDFITWSAFWMEAKGPGAPVFRASRAATSSSVERGDPRRLWSALACR